jgi:hypothetical protein
MGMGMRVWVTNQIPLQGEGDLMGCVLVGWMDVYGVEGQSNERTMWCASCLGWSIAWSIAYAQVLRIT